jgi:starch synthase
MTILFGHPTGSPNAHHAALAHLEAGRLEAFCVSWVPSSLTLTCLQAVPGLQSLARRLARRRFPPLVGAPTVQGGFREWSRLLRRLAGGDMTRLADDANDWLMHTMRREAARASVTTVHAFEDCALWPFEAARAQGKACIYDMPIAYFTGWQETKARLMRTYASWLPDGRRAANDEARLHRKRREMELADLVLAPCHFAEATIRVDFPHKPVALAPYGVDAAFWSPAADAPRGDKLRFVFAGQISLRKGIPALIAAWRKASLRDAELELVGAWHLAERERAALPPGVTHRPPCAPEELRARYRVADVVVFPSHFEGFGLALVEAMACGLPALASDAGIAPEIVSPSSGRVIAAGDVDALVENLRWFAAHRDELGPMGKAARTQAELYTWPRYRARVSEAVASYV